MKTYKWKYSRLQIAKDMESAKRWDSNLTIDQIILRLLAKSSKPKEKNDTDQQMIDAGLGRYVRKDDVKPNKIEPPKNIKYLNSDLKRWVKEVTDSLNKIPKT